MRGLRAGGAPGGRTLNQQIKSSFVHGVCWFEGVRYQACGACQTLADLAG